MPMRTQRLLYLSAHQMSAYSWQAGSLTVEDRFAANEDGYSAFAAYLEHHPQSTYRLLANIAEEGFQIEVIPYLRGRDRQTVINRKLGQYFFGANLTAALSLGYEKTKRKDERLLLAALTNNEAFAPWLAALAQAQVALAGLYSLPLIAPSLLRKLKVAEERCLLLTVQDQSIRQSYLEQGEVHFSRLTPLQNSSLAGIAQTFAAEAVKLQQYLTSQRLIGRNQPLTAYILAHPTALKAIEASCSDTPNLRFSIIDTVEAAQRTGLKTAPHDSHAEPLFLHWLASAPPKLQFANDEQRHGHHLGLIRRALLGSGALILLGSLLFTGQELIERNGILAANAALLKETELARQRYDDIARTFPPIPTDSASLRQIIDRYAELERLSTTPAGLYQEISRALQSTPAIELETIDWRLGGNEATNVRAGTAQAPAALPSGSESVVLNGALRLGPQSSARRLLAAFQQFVDALQANPALQVDVLQRPVDIEPGKSLKGRDLKTEDDKPHTFSLRVTRKIAP